MWPGRHTLLGSTVASLRPREGRQPVKVSVVIPTYNRVARLRSALAAFATQTIDSADFEVVVISDGAITAPAWRLAICFSSLTTMSSPNPT